ncbi:MAG: histidine kinase N-terminal 7TM domain-containing protein [Spirochaetota bacterium]
MEQGNMNFQNIPYTMIILGTAVVMLIYAFYIWLNERIPHPPSSALLLLSGAGWLITMIFEYGTVTFQSKLFWSKLQYIGLEAIPVAWLVFCLQYTGRNEFIKPLHITLLSIIPCVFILLVFTNEFHGFIWSRVSAAGRPFLEKDPSVGFWVLVGYAYLLIIIGVYLLVVMMLRSRKFYGRQAAALICAAIFPWLASAIDLTGIKIVHDIELTPIAFSVTSLIVVYGFARLRFRDTVPLAYQTTIESMNDSVILLDQENRLIYMNPAASQFFPETGTHKSSAHLDALWPDLFLVIERFSGKTFKRCEAELSGRVYDIQLSPIFDWRNNLVSRIVVLRDITQLRQAEENMRKMKEELEIRVAARTEELIQANRALQAEIAERKQAEEIIKASLKEKEILLKEIHHRVKNNLQVISSLLKLQLKYVRDRQSYGMLKDTQTRIKSMGIIHEILYKSGDLSRINIANYIRPLIKYLFSTYGIDTNSVELSINTEEVLLDIDTVILCCLIINELVSNSLKHAFPRGRKGRLWVEFHVSNGKFALTVRDDGIGLPGDLDLQSTETFGLRIVTILTRQLGGSIEIDRNKGTLFSVTFSHTQENLRTVGG